MTEEELIKSIVDNSVKNSITIDQALKAFEVFELKRRNDFLDYLKPHIEAFAAKMETFLTLENNG